jgi:LytS/YehU family sensor histidine kinase
MLLQPLYENAVKHGVYESTENVRIVTSAKVLNGYLEITISNNYEPEQSSTKGTGTGLLNVTRRLEIFYRNNGSLKTMAQNGIYTVKLFIPTNYP